MDAEELTHPMQNDAIPVGIEDCKMFGAPRVCEYRSILQLYDRLDCGLQSSRLRPCLLQRSTFG